ncbi:MAG: MoxR family ATPase [Gammaproteobacteria bacterium]|jgi:MoxR-like ATPase|nr:MoxR family ATPase [Gammaproteobacteria bacterium]
MTFPAPETASQLDAPVVIQRIIDQIERVILGKTHQIRLALTCLLARGHLLIEDVPGVGKTMLSHAIAQVLGLQFQRIQFTSDMLPADVLGVSVYERATGLFTFHPGPVFSQLILADEINRASPKTQSALLEAMEEEQITIEGETRRLPAPFFVIATQNPSYQIGTFPLPESQLDRFLMRIALGYPDGRAERNLLKGRDRREILQELEPGLDPEDLEVLQAMVATIHVSDPLLDYVQAILEYTRRGDTFRGGLSPRAGVALLRSARTWSLLEGRDFVSPEDVQHVLPHVARHRLVSLEQSAGEGAVDPLAVMLDEIPIP